MKMCWLGHRYVQDSEHCFKKMIVVGVCGLRVTDENV